MRAACVLPEPPLPGVVQSVPDDEPMAIAPLPSADFEIEPQLSTMRTYWPVSVVVPVVPEKMPAEFV